ncbi:hypothetical protein Z043_111558 [Scleropages formosus]|uniref:A-kinase interacting protein 1 n=1 Tax=Scleropages formosus TaxID=113540 RepID=A0A0P7V958_SCLFO|nr:A-kinase-interacting protein 1 [Scleropages formosus]KPP69670.1 hypothetical protein Z043_111558 [Scleropages formosus]
MATQAWMDSSLRCSSRLALQVLERARARRVHWPRVTGASEVLRAEDARRRWGSSHPRQSGSEQVEEWCTGTGVRDAFGTLMELMAHTTDECKRFYTSVPPHGPSEREAKHICRYHSQEHPQMSRRVRHVERPRTPEDFHIEVPPGTYAVTAGAEGAGQQTQLVRVGVGESVNLTFHL